MAITYVRFTNNKSTNKKHGFSLHLSTKQLHKEQKHIRVLVNEGTCFVCLFLFFLHFHRQPHKIEAIIFLKCSQSRCLPERLKLLWFKPLYMNVERCKYISPSIFANWQRPMNWSWQKINNWANHCHTVNRLLYSPPAHGHHGNSHHGNIHHNQ